MITTFGSLGDTYPYLAIALGLQARGHEAIVATGECYRRKVESLGLGLRPVRPDSDWVTDPVAMRRFMHPRWGLVRVLREKLLPALRECYDDLLAATEGADLLVANQAVAAARLAAEKRAIPWASAMHVPIGIFSAHDPPLLPGFPGPSKVLRPLGPACWKPLAGVVKWVTQPWARPLNRLRKEIGLPPAPERNPLIDGHAPSLHLTLFSELLAAKQPDWPPQTIVTGFPWFDHGGQVGLPEELTRFLNAGPPPIVFTLGTAVATDAGPFYEHGVAAALSLGRRAVLVLGRKITERFAADLPEGVIAIDYAPFSELFPRAAAIVHHGGIGTTGLAMRAGRPMLVMPVAWDQPDNAARAARLGIARILPRHRYTPDRAAAELRELLANPSYAQRASQVGEQVRQEDGVRVACDAIESLIATACRSGPSLPLVRPLES